MVGGLAELRIQIGQQVIRLGGFRAFQQQAQHLAADLGHPLALTRHEGFGLVQEGFHVLRAAGRVGMDVRMAV